MSIEIQVIKYFIVIIEEVHFQNNATFDSLDAKHAAPFKCAGFASPWHLYFVVVSILLRVFLRFDTKRCPALLES